jgi:hypothetical protein
MTPDKNSSSAYEPQEAVRPLDRSTTLKCKRCGGSTFERLPRFGFWQEKVMPFFDRYPWRCVACGKLVYRSRRSTPPRRQF